MTCRSGRQRIAGLDRQGDHGVVCGFDRNRIARCSRGQDHVVVVARVIGIAVAHHETLAIDDHVVHRVLRRAATEADMTFLLDCGGGNGERFCRVVGDRARRGNRHGIDAEWRIGGVGRQMQNLGSLLCSSRAGGDVFAERNAGFQFGEDIRNGRIDGDVTSRRAVGGIGAHRGFQRRNDSCHGAAGRRGGTEGLGADRQCVDPTIDGTQVTEVDGRASFGGAADCIRVGARYLGQRVDSHRDGRRTRTFGDRDVVAVGRRSRAGIGGIGSDQGTELRSDTVERRTSSRRYVFKVVRTDGNAVATTLHQGHPGQVDHARIGSFCTCGQHWCDSRLGGGSALPLLDIQRNRAADCVRQEQQMVFAGMYRVIVAVDYHIDGLVGSDVQRIAELDIAGLSGRCSSRHAHCARIRDRSRISQRVVFSQRHTGHGERLIRRDCRDEQQIMVRIWRHRELVRRFDLGFQVRQDCAPAVGDLPGTCADRCRGGNSRDLDRERVAIGKLAAKNDFVTLRNLHPGWRDFVHVDIDDEAGCFQRAVFSNLRHAIRHRTGIRSGVAQLQISAIAVRGGFVQHHACGLIWQRLIVANGFGIRVQIRRVIVEGLRIRRHRASDIAHRALQLEQMTACVDRNRRCRGFLRALQRCSLDVIDVHVAAGTDRDWRVVGQITYFANAQIMRIVVIVRIVTQTAACTATGSDRDRAVECNHRIDEQCVRLVDADIALRGSAYIDRVDQRVQRHAVLRHYLQMIGDKHRRFVSHHGFCGDMQFTGLRIGSDDASLQLQGTADVDCDIAGRSIAGQAADKTFQGQVIDRIGLWQAQFRNEDIFLRTQFVAIHQQGIVRLNVDETGVGWRASSVVGGGGDVRDGIHAVHVTRLEHLVRTFGDEHHLGNRAGGGAVETRAFNIDGTDH